MLTIYAPFSNKKSKAWEVFNGVEKSWPDQITKLDNAVETDPVRNSMFWGFVGNNREMVNYRQEAVILFSSQVPSAPEEETGYLKTAESRSDEFLTALYRVWKVDHTFENGQFTQRLSMVRDTITDLSIMMDEGEPDIAEEENQIVQRNEAWQHQVVF